MALLSSGPVFNVIRSITLTSLMTFSLCYDFGQLDIRERKIALKGVCVIREL